MNSTFNKMAYHGIKLLFKQKRVERLINRYIIEKASPNIKIVSPMDTMEEIKNHIISKKPGVYLRFGDGDALLVDGQDDMFQTASPTLCKEMKDTFALNGKAFFKSLSIHSHSYGYEKEMCSGNHLVSQQYANQLLGIVYPYFIGQPIYSPIALHYAACYNPTIANAFLKLLKEKTFLFIGNEEVAHQFIDKLFGHAMWVKTPAKNAYHRLNDLEKEAKTALQNHNNHNGNVVVIAAGCAGRVLAKRLWQENNKYFYFDFGSLLDGIAGHQTRTWLRKETIDYNSLLKDL